MRVNFAFAALFSYILGTIFCADDPTAKYDGVIDLDPQNFDQFVNGAKHALIEFYAPWCGHCKKMTGQFAELGRRVQKDPKLSSKFVIGKVNADSHRELGERFGITGFPTLKHFQRGKSVTESKAYKGGRDADAFMKFIEGVLEEDSIGRLESMDEFAKRFLEADDKGEALAQAEAAAGALPEADKEVGDLYVKMMKKAKDKGMGFFKAEHERLNRMMSSGSLTPQKVAVMSKRAGTLSAFLPEDA